MLSRVPQITLVLKSPSKNEYNRWQFAFSRVNDGHLFETGAYAERRY